MRWKATRAAVVLLDAGLTDGYRWEGTPVLLLVDLAGDFDLARLESWGIADYISRDATARELTRRVETLIGRPGNAAASGPEPRFLRESLRNVSAAIRGTNSPQQMARAPGPRLRGNPLGWTTSGSPPSRTRGCQGSAPSGACRPLQAAGHARFL
jgi:hypothetical protein